MSYYQSIQACSDRLFTSQRSCCVQRPLPALRAHIVAAAPSAAGTAELDHTADSNKQLTRRSILSAGTALITTAAGSPVQAAGEAAGALIYLLAYQAVRVLHRGRSDVAGEHSRRQANLVNARFAGLGSLARFLQSKQEVYALAPIGAGKRKLAEAAALLAAAPNDEARAAALKLIRASSFNCYVYEVRL